MAAAEDSAREERRNYIARRRTWRFSRICDRYAQRDDPLIEFGTVARLILATAPGLTTRQLIELFMDDVQAGVFATREYGPRRIHRMHDLIDLQQAKVFEPGKYSLHPDVWTVQHHMWGLSARRGTWAAWIQRRGWAVPPELTGRAKRQVRHDRPLSRLVEDLEAIQQEHLKTPGARPLTRREMEQKVRAPRHLVSKAYDYMDGKLKVRRGRPKNSTKIQPRNSAKIIPPK